MKNMDRKVLAITYAGRSGSVFLASLLDNHPNTIQFPGTILMGFSDFWSDLKSNKSHFIINTFISTYRVLFDPTFECYLHGCGTNPGIGLSFDSMGKNQNERISINQNLFTNELYKIYPKNVNININDFFISLHIALAKCLNIKFNDSTVIVFSLHTPSISRARFLLNFNTTIIQMVRNPLISATSHLKHHGIGPKEYWRYLFSDIKTYDTAIPQFEKNTFALKLEDLHSTPKKELLKICKLLNISWHDNLLKSTFYGKQWHNLKNTNKVSGFNKVIINKKHDDLLSDSDHNQFQFIFGHIYNNFKYKYKKGNLLNFFKLSSIEKKSLSDTFFIFDYISNRIRLMHYFIVYNKFIRFLFGKKSLDLLRIKLLK